jgi:methyl-accepting chemotaxis protein
MRQGALQQHSETDQVATAINEMTATVQEVSRHASETAKSTSEADEQGRTAKQVIGNAMNAVQALASNVDNANEVILRLKGESENIGTVLAVINGIAEQTNLLALNAAIEAARAGEQGRGFAVVAEEVRNLANRTQSSTQEISEMIDRLQSEASSAVSAMEEGKSQARNGVELTEDASGALNEIANAINHINDMNIQIAEAAKEQSLVAEEINRNIVNVNDIATQSVSGAEQTADDSRELARMAEEMRYLVSDFKLQ